MKKETFHVNGTATTKDSQLEGSFLVDKVEIVSILMIMTFGGRNVVR